MRILRTILLVAAVCASLLLLSGEARLAQSETGSDAVSRAVSRIDPLLRGLHAALATPEELGSGTEAPRGDYHVDRSDEVGPSLMAALSRVLSIGTTRGQPWANVLLHVTGEPSDLVHLGVQTTARVGDVMAAHMPLDQLDEVVALDGIVYAQAARRLRIHNEVSVPQTGARLAQLDFGATGQGVLIGYIDTGIDFRHADFRESDGSTRIKYLLDLSDPGDIDGDGLLDGLDDFGGTVYTETQINAALSGTGVVNQRDIVGHGTHGAGSAAGSGLAVDRGVPPGTYAGMAPEADLIVVKAARDNSNPGAFEGQDVVAGLQFVDEKASELGRPYVVNLSLGDHYGAHDGSSLEERAIDQLVGAGVPGKAVVISAGNEGGFNIHAGGWVPDGGTHEVSFLVSYASYVLIDIWYSGQDVFRIGVRNPDGRGQDPIEVLPGGSSCVGVGSNAVCVFSEPINVHNGDKEIVVLIEPAGGAGFIEPGGEWRFILHGWHVRNGRFDAWVVDGAEFVSDLEAEGRRVAMPGTARNAITVGAHVSRDRWVDVRGRQRQTFVTVGELASFSSDGPTRDGRQKPEITAPGQYIGSSYSADAPAGSLYSMFSSDSWVLWDGLHAIGQGTSFSAPHVTGAVALIFERNPTLDAIQVREILTSTARADDFTGPVPNAAWGFGKLDVYAALKRMGAVASSFKIYLPAVVGR